MGSPSSGISPGPSRAGTWLLCTVSTLISPFVSSSVVPSGKEDTEVIWSLALSWQTRNLALCSLYSPALCPVGLLAGGPHLHSLMWDLFSSQGSRGPYHPLPPSLPPSLFPSLHPSLPFADCASPWLLPAGSHPPEEEMLSLSYFCVSA